jgi:NhaP-type Na+/H+ or K+/H+ antiporter
VVLVLTFGVVLFVTVALSGLDWTTSLLLGAILSPTDPVFASAIVSRSEVPRRLRKLLNIESGVNDGLALSVLVSLWGAGLPKRERYAAAWFGPKGFASVVYGLLAVQSGIPAAQTVFELVAVTIAVSIVAHSMSDVPVAKAFDVEALAGLPDTAGPGPRAWRPGGGEVPVTGHRGR